MDSTESAKPVTASRATNVESLASYRARRQDISQDRLAESHAAGRGLSKPTPATLLVLEERFPCCASIEVNDLHWVRAQFSARTRDQLIATVKKILCQEFGRKRVRRDAIHFEIRHGKIEKLIKTLVQVQFYTNQILLPEYNLLGERNELNGVSITWGVGRDLSQATKDRIRKSNQKYYRR